ncbi:MULTISPECIES: 2-oxoacid:acceptor oxidoreductase subunit alpha [Mammaliicoccus]|jgi:2-oxoglutarate ferredoxin oxidoreductase subunit alpha|uniref:2-oxoacid:acceptor oxidoreductase subunit alpha n=1 Tax=Mammaliicoccus sciuri TaxID=1296 RepID=A0AAW5LQD6_MAMSC|nr:MULTISPECIES: 2-oxoacid:acceptor oxidoreductase subunit alpha [Mammaliicoccus]KTT81097.1 2-oxoglutarate ferredoxin oxidoreductase subunit alpha [Mammaliicoccus sciuri]MBF0718878.1 2-oxoacid:acceptor oxidoreductase subunit alpha [Mammaliicoccus sciuri]MBF0773422.1 2-oxoacid:acceptor oxidoreductase subunit alpha [Mammaliicoccus sciuri]MBG9209920.1 2-oxoacid:acceptor oxidoreductase subunit alpha [Mammaliicoccus sciuri]MBO1208697.1 2-oxoacid:acceptor oxidoreductase subunit alpha [Mammaliicoccus
MKSQISWKVGGQQGEGIESTGEIFATAMNRQGYYLYGYRHFSSRIKGGHTNNKIRVSSKPVRAISDDLDILIAFDQETIEVNYHEMLEGSIIIADEKAKPQNPEDSKAQLVSLPFTGVAKELGTALMKNMVAVGATCAVMDLDTKVFESLIKDLFGKKGESVVDLNIQALNEGYRLMSEQMDDLQSEHTLEPTDSEGHLFMIGNDAIGLGAVAAGVRFMAAYPITPASEIMEYMIDRLPALGGTVIQTEDEIAACTMAIGSNYAGVRSFTSSAGPGLSLMMESIGLSGMTETPLVIVNTQRGGPSTGLPTKQEQSDLMQMIYGTHGDIPKIVLAPTSASDAFYLTVEAFNLAEEYQCPVILLSDLQLSLGKQTVESLDYSKVEIRRGALVEGDLEKQEDKAYFKRYALTDSGISPRILPGTIGGIHHVTGVEHDEEGKPSESAENRQKQMDKRMRKTAQLLINEPVESNEKYEEADILYVGFISTAGAIEEAISRLDKQNVKVNHIQIRQLHPFPSDVVQEAFNKAKKVVVAEHNYQGQLSNIIKMNINHQNKIINQTKYDGTPFLPHEIEDKALEIVSNMKELI